jgi:hypothetical protein
MLIGFRFLSGFFGSASIANGGGTISDMYDALERTRVVGWYILGPLTGIPSQLKGLTCRSCSGSCYRWFHDAITFMEMDILAHAYSKFGQYDILYNISSGNVRADSSISKGSGTH